MTPQPTDPADCRSRIIAAATVAFRQEGYRASIERIAQLAGVARQTLYNYFPGKDALFAEMTRRCSADILVMLEDGDAAHLRETLLRFGLALRGRLLGEEGLAAFRALLGEAVRFPELARAFYDNGPARTLARLSAFLAQAMQAGQLRREEPEFAAEMLIGMLLGIERTRLLCGAGALDAVAEPARTARIVDGFLRTYGHEPERVNN